MACDRLSLMVMIMMSTFLSAQHLKFRVVRFWAYRSLPFMLRLAKLERRQPLCPFSFTLRCSKTTFQVLRCSFHHYWRLILKKRGAEQSIYSTHLSGLYTSFFSNSRSCCVAGADTLTFTVTFGAFILIFRFRFQRREILWHELSMLNIGKILNYNFSLRPTLLEIFEVTTEDGSSIWPEIETSIGYCPLPC